MTIAQRIANRFLQAAGRFQLDRTFYKPEGVQPIYPEGTDLEVYSYSRPVRGGLDTKERPFLVIFKGKASKPIVNNYYLSESQRDKSLAGYIDASRSGLERKQQKRDEAKKYVHGIMLFDILYTSWGYDQTNVDFYEVTEIVGDKMIKVREVGKSIAREEQGADYVVATPGKFVGPEIKARVGVGDRVTIKGHGASKWDGKPIYETASGYGH